LGKKDEKYLAPPEFPPAWVELATGLHLRQDL